MKISLLYEIFCNSERVLLLSTRNGKDMLRREQEWSQPMKAPEKSFNKLGWLGDSGSVEHFWRAERKTRTLL